MVTDQGEDKPSPLLCRRIGSPGSSIVGATLVVAQRRGQDMVAIMYLSYSPNKSFTVARFRWPFRVV
jgi:hypothetical protein